MIENPKVGQRVWVDGTSGIVAGTVRIVGALVHVSMPDGVARPYFRARLYDSLQSAAAALRNQAQELLLVAAKLEQEEPNESA